MTIALKSRDKDLAVNQATLRLFNGIQVPEQLLKDSKKEKPKRSHVLAARTVPHGYIVDERIGWDFTSDVFETIESVIGLSGVRANAAFHKSWKVVEESSITELVSQQIAHYFTTYGFEALGIYDEDSVYVPHEKLEVPELREDIPLIVVHALGEQDILDGVTKLGGGIALAQGTLDDIMAVMTRNKDAYLPAIVKEIHNRELKALLSDLYGIVPSDPTEFLRHVVSKLTDESLLIKNGKLIAALKAANGKFLDELMLKAPDDLASIFLRYKPLFLAMKSISRNKTMFNQLRRRAVKLHKPLAEDYLNNVTNQIKKGTLYTDDLVKRLATASVFRKIRLAYALNFRLHADSSIVYRVRNGKGWATEFTWPKGLQEVTKNVLGLVMDSIAQDVGKKVRGKTVYAPNVVDYAIPATEKQFVGNVPNGTSVAVGEDMICGVHWYDVNGERTDLDLAMVSIAGKTGWDAEYRTDDNRVLFSGDLTAAPLPDGAAELFYLKKNSLPQLVTLNYYNHSEGYGPVPTKILIAKEKASKDFEAAKGYVVDPNNVLATANIVVEDKQSVLGLVANGTYYFTNVNIGGGRSSNVNEHATHARQYLISNCINSLSLADLLKAAGATVVHEKPDGEFIDLSIENLDKTTILDLLK